MRIKHPMTWQTAALACALAPLAGAASDAHVQRQIQHREQQQIELQLKMQQQRDRATRPQSSPSADFQRRQVERDQQQRLQQLHEQQSRAMVAPHGSDASEAATREAERQRGSQSGAGQLQRFDSERRLEAERSAVPEAPR
jgi:hypothetical protein